MDIDKWLALPVYLQVMVGGGYLAYLLARQGFRRKEKASDQFLGVVAFGLPALPAWFVVVDLTGSALIAGAVALVSCVLFGLLWRVWLWDVWLDFAHRRQISGEDGKGNIWDTLTQDTQLHPSQITVFLKNGERLFCDNAQLFQDSAIGAPMLFDGDGNIAFFVTHEWKDGAWAETDGIRGGDWGDRLTYIPSTEVVKVNIRYHNLGSNRASV